MLATGWDARADARGAPPSSITHPRPTFQGASPRHETSSPSQNAAKGTMAMAGETRDNAALLGADLRIVPHTANRHPLPICAESTYPNWGATTKTPPVCCNCRPCACAAGRRTRPAKDSEGHAPNLAIPCACGSARRSAARAPGRGPQSQAQRHRSPKGQRAGRVTQNKDDWLTQRAKKMRRRASHKKQMANNARGRPMTQQGVACPARSTGHPEEQAKQHTNNTRSWTACRPYLRL